MTANNTLKIANVTIADGGASGPNAKCFITEVELDNDWPDYVAASKTTVCSQIQGGYQTPSGTGLDQTSCITTLEQCYHSTGAAVFAATILGPACWKGTHPVNWTAGSTGVGEGFHFSVSINSWNCTATKTVKYKVKGYILEE